MTELNYTDIKFQSAIQYLKEMCPHLEKHWNDVNSLYAHNDNELLQLVPHIVDSMEEHNDIATIFICKFEWDYVTMQDTVNILQNKYLKNNIEFKFIFPEQEDPASDTPYKNYPIILIQKKNISNWFSQAPL